MGVKSLWKLLTPVGRPILLETMEGKVLAIDSSIWIYQFQATMRDNDGKLFVNAHVLGFLRRICKLLFYGIKPVFVFDGGVPTLKRSTIEERRRKKTGAATAHVKVAERLLAAQMRREAVKQAQQHSAPNRSKGKGQALQGSVTLDEDTVYLEDLDNPAPKTPAKAGSSKDKEPGSSSSKKKPRFHDHDPYHLPDIDFEKAVARATRGIAPDPRLTTEEEMREFIDEMRPEDFDVNAPEFRELPTEVQYEIIGDLRLKSRQTSYKRLQNMLKNAPTPLDFSKEQIKNLKQRNKLTQQLLITTDSIGKAHVEIPIRIASERNREYILKKNEGENGGWILGMRDEGTQAKPIVLDPDRAKDKPAIVEGEDSDDDMEEVAIPPAISMDPHLREYQRELALSALARRVKQPSKPLSTRIQKPPPLFDLDDDDELGRKQDLMDENEEDPAFHLAIRESLEDQQASDLRRALDASRQETIPTTPARRSSASFQRLPSDLVFEDEENLFTTPGRLATALSIAGAGPSTSRMSSFSRAPQTPTIFGKPKLLLPNPQQSLPHSPQAESVSDDDMEEVPVVPSVSVEVTLQPTTTDAIPPLIPAGGHKSTSPPPAREPSLEYVENDTDFRLLPNLLPPRGGESSDSEDMEEVIVQQDPIESRQPSTTGGDRTLRPHSPSSLVTGPGRTEESPALSGPFSPIAGPSRYSDESDHDEPLTDWSRSPSPRPRAPSDSNTTFNPPMQTEDTWDAAQEMDPDAEQGEFARFMSQIKGRNLEDVRREIEAEINGLKQQRKVAMRDSEDITRQMISQIMVMLRLFGIPYITAPMEAEAQCAELVSLGLVEGIITDDSDVFLFGGRRVFKHMFNRSKTVECFLASDLTRELGLDRDTLIRLAYLLGSDYVDGLPGVGPVVAMELLKEFPGSDGLHKFKDWWMKVQTGRDGAEDNRSKFRKRFKKKFKDLYLPAEWPNPAVRDAYYHPTVDESEEPFKWGLPDLDGLRGLFHEELGWSQQKVDDLLLPVVQRVGKRQQAAALNKQGHLDGFFDIHATGTNNGSYAPRKRQQYASKRLQQVVTDYRNEQNKRRGGSKRLTPLPDENGDEGKGSEEERGAKRRKTSSPPGKLAKGTGKRVAVAGSGRSRGRGRRIAKRKKTIGSDDDEYSFIQVDQDQGSGPAETSSVQLRPRPKPRGVYKGLQGDTDGQEVEDDQGLQET